MRIFSNAASPENIQRCILRQHDGLGVHNAAVDDHGQRLIDGSSDTSISSALGSDAPSSAQASATSARFIGVNLSAPMVRRPILRYTNGLLISRRFDISTNRP